MGLGCLGFQLLKPDTWNLLLCCFCSYTYNFKIYIYIYLKYVLPVWLAIIGCFFCLVPTHCRSHSISLWKSQDHVVDFTLHHLGWHASHRGRPRLASLCPLDGFVSLGSGPRAVGVSGRRANYCWWVAQLWNALVQIFEVVKFTFPALGWQLVYVPTNPSRGKNKTETELTHPRRSFLEIKPLGTPCLGYKRSPWAEVTNIGVFNAAGAAATVSSTASKRMSSNGIVRLWGLEVSTIAFQTLVSFSSTWWVVETHQIFSSNKCMKDTCYQLLRHLAFSFCRIFPCVGL